ncbi:MAG TPA: gliding motility-associated ABC transporter permease subunit GldF [Bacteroidia bacterium]|nr:gliding motility-associated ABC transporter permease subunit GldF [Bacteroidia bacterium]HNO71509.1 gliding motility-associated ABC transporter permease subunit GldF [Bacteroidia bacterium]
MFTLYKKEIRAFLSSLIGYIAICVFLLLVGLFLWILPTDSNLLNNGYAGLDSLFELAPWVFLFLIPSITMRSFADEKKAGTIEFLLTKPLTDMQIILAKYLAGVTLVLFSLLPTLIYYYSIYKLGNPIGNIDSGGTWGSYIGLFFLASAFTSIGIFASSLSDNQIIAFILSVFLCFFSYIGFEYISRLDLFGKVDDFILSIGINDHYISMSRGVIDTRDIVYFLSLISLFTLLTKTSLESRKW